MFFWNSGTCSTFHYFQIAIRNNALVPPWWSRLSASPVGGAGSIPGRRTAILRAVLCSWERKKIERKRNNAAMNIFYINLNLCVYFWFSSVAQLCQTLCNRTDCSTSGLLVHHQLPEFTQSHVHWVGDAIQPSHTLSSPSPPTFNLSQHQGLFKWVSSLHQVAKVLELHLQHQSFQWIFGTDLL